MSAVRVVEKSVRIHIYTISSQKNYDNTKEYQKLSIEAITK